MLVPTPQRDHADSRLTSGSQESPHTHPVGSSDPPPLVPIIIYRASLCSSVVERQFEKADYSAIRQTGRLGQVRDLIQAHLETVVRVLHTEPHASESGHTHTVFTAVYSCSLSAAASTPADQGVWEGKPRQHLHHPSLFVSPTVARPRSPFHR